MSANEPASAEHPSQAVQAEAAAWIARLHRKNRTSADEAGFRRWLQADPANAAAFERMTEIWDRSGRLKSGALARVRAKQHAQPTQRWKLVSIGAAVACIALLAVFVWIQGSDVSTGIGEQRVVTLEDGSRITLNTATALDVRFDKKQRRVELKAGEALFEIAKRPNWPFVVAAGDREVTALGTSFVVRRDEERIAVTLVEGTVKVAPVAIDPVIPRTTDVKILSPGQRLTIDQHQAPRLDRLPAEKATAWRRGLVELDATPLPLAIAEMNRYSRVQIELEHPDPAAIQVSGVFRAGDSLEFARALARAYGLTVEEDRRRIVLATGQTAQSPKQD